MIFQETSAEDGEVGGSLACGVAASEETWLAKREAGKRANARQGLGGRGGGASSNWEDDGRFAALAGAGNTLLPKPQR